MSRPKKRDRGLIAISIIGVLLAAGGVFAIVTLLADDSIPTYGSSMRPTLEGRQNLDVDTDAYESSSPEVNDIVTAQGPEGVELEKCEEAAPRSPCPVASEDYSTIRVLKRIVGLPGDSIAFTADGRTLRNGEVAAEPFINPCAGECALPNPITVPDDHYFLAGDNRPVSSDSRFWGPVPSEAIDGRVELP